MIGIIAVKNAVGFLKRFEKDIWVIGGAKLYELTIDLVNEL